MTDTDKIKAIAELDNWNTVTDEEEPDGARTVSPNETWIKQIQLDAIKHGMTLAADLCIEVQTEKRGGILHSESIGASECATRIRTARDNKTEV